MAIIPQIITEDRASGAQVIDGILKFYRQGSNELNFTPSVVGNKKTWTYSVWLKKLSNALDQGIFNPRVGGDGSNDCTG